MTTILSQAPGPPVYDAVADPHRLAALRRVRDFLIHDSGQVHAILCEISNHRAVGYEVEAAIATLDGAAAEIATYRPGRIQRLAAFMPSNVLLYSYTLYLLVPALFTDELVFRPSGQVKDQMLRLHELLAAHHRLPILAASASHRAFLDDHVLPAEVAVFTGSYANAERIRGQLRPGQLFLFLGAGVNPFIVAPGADVGRAARDAVEARMLNSGQDCLGPDLFCVHESLLEEFLAELVAQVKALRYGPYNDPDADYGPVFYEGALEEATVFLARNGRGIVHGGGVSLHERHIEPTILLGPTPTPRTQVPEFFAPVFNVSPYADEQRLAATLTTGMFTERSLGASVYGVAPRLVAALQRRATVSIDSSLLTLDDGNAPFGGYGRMANYISVGDDQWSKPILISKAVAEHGGAAR